MRTDSVPTEIPTPSPGDPNATVPGPNAPLPPPGMVAKVEVHGQSYEEMLDEADTLFCHLFNTRDWAFLAAEIEPDEVTQSFGGAQVSSWRGIFFALTVDTEVNK